MKRVSWILLLAVLPLCAQTARPKSASIKSTYTPDLSQWRLEVTPDLGGWITEGKQELRIKLVDPHDPAPPKDEVQSHYGEGGYEGEGEGDYNPETENKSAAELRAQRLAAEEQVRQNAWRDRQITVWCNGDTAVLSVRVGYTTTYTVDSQNGENRLEIWEKDSGKRVVRSWWASAFRTRLRVFQIRNPNDEWGGGNLEILEPNGDLASQGKRTTSGGTLSWSGTYLHPTPPMGTYTLRWTGGYRGGKPFKVVIEATLDSGTDQERRWHFERLILPGAGPVTLGTLDVEN
jgi:hypothetical protein